MSGEERNQIQTKLQVDWLLIGAAVLFLAAVACLVWVLTSNQTSATPPATVQNLPQDRLLYLSNQDGWPDLYTIDLTGKVTGRLTNTAQAEYGATWSPDGRRIAYTGMDGDQAMGSYQQTHNVFIMSADGTNSVLVAKDAYNPVWSPDGKWLLYSRAVPMINNKPATNPTPIPTPSDPFLDNGDGSDNQPPDDTSLNHDYKISLYLISTITDTKNPPAERLLVDNAVAGSWSPDSKRIAYIGGDNVINHKRTLNLINIDGTGQISLSNQAKFANLDVLYAAWSPDNSQIAFSAIDPDLDKMMLYRISSQGGAPRYLADYAGSGHEMLSLIWGYADFSSPAPRLHLGPAWSPNSQSIAFSNGGNQITVIDNTSLKQKVFPVGTAALGQSNDSVLNLAWEPDNRRIFFDRATVSRDNLMQNAISYIYDFFNESLDSLDTLNKSTQTLANSDAGFLTPTCCGQDLLGAGTFGLVASTAKPTTAPTTNVTATNSITTTGKLVYTSGVGQRQLVVYDFKTQKRQVLDSGSFQTLDFVVDPTGRYVTYLEINNNLIATLYVATLDGTQKRQLSSGTGAPNDLNSSVSWAQDGSLLGFQPLNGDKSLSSGLYIFNTKDIAAANAAPKLITRANVTAFTWSPTGHTLAFKVDAENYLVYIVDPTATASQPTLLVRTGKPPDFSTGMGRGLVWSPDGQFLAFGGMDVTTFSVTWVVNMQGQIFKISGQPVSRILGWTKDSTRIVVEVATYTQSTAVETINVTGTGEEWRSYGEGYGPIAAASGDALLFYTQHILPPDYYFQPGLQSAEQTLSDPHLSLVNLSTGFQDDIKLKFPPYFGFKGRFFTWSPDGKIAAFYENNSIFGYVQAPAGGSSEPVVIARAFAVDKIMWISG